MDARLGELEAEIERSEAERLAYSTPSDQDPLRRLPAQALSRNNLFLTVTTIRNLELSITSKLPVINRRANDERNACLHCPVLHVNQLH
jgi:hypothetical protein